MFMRRTGRGGPVGRRGTVVIMVAFGMTVIVGVMAVVLDGGLLLAERVRAQAVADSAANAAAGYLSKNYTTDAGLDPSGKAKAAGLALASGNTYTNDGVTSTVTINIPPKSGTFIGTAGYVEAIVGHNQPRFFSALWGSGSLSVGGRSVARGLPMPYSPAAVICLDPSSASSLYLAGSAQVVTASTIQVNSSSSSAVNANNTGHAKASQFNIVGNYTTSSSGYLTGPVVIGASAVSDPLASYPTPSTTGLATAPSFPAYGSFTINPGVYNGGATFGGGSQVTMNPGLYYMKGGSFNVANGVTLAGAGVTIYVDNGGGTISFQGGGTISLSPPTSGPWAGMLLYLDRNSSQAINIANGSTTTISGTVYAGGSQVSFAGGASFNQSGSQYICKRLNVSNNAYVGINWSSGSVVRKSAYNIVE